MGQLFTDQDYEFLHSQVFRSDYSGYKPSVIEIPNGDGKADVEKRYAHIAKKYFTTDEQWTTLMPYLERAHDLAWEMGRLIGLPNKYMPDIRHSALRILDYPPGSISNRHEDFDLFTLMCYRDQPEMFQSDEVEGGIIIDQLRMFDPQAHLGQLGTVIGLGAATPHWVLPSETRQRSIVHFVIPDHESVLPGDITVRGWLNERMARSRIELKYE